MYNGVRCRDEIMSNLARRKKRITNKAYHIHKERVTPTCIRTRLRVARRLHTRKKPFERQEGGSQPARCRSLRYHYNKHDNALEENERLHLPAREKSVTANLFSSAAQSRSRRAKKCVFREHAHVNANTQSKAHSLGRAARKKRKQTVDRLSDTFRRQKKHRTLTKQCTP